MEREVLLTGIGGQGVQLAAQVLARAAAVEGRQVMLFGVYSGMMRGGNSDSTIVVADTDIQAPPLISHAWSAIVMHHKFWEPMVAKLRPGAVVLVNSSLFEGEVDREAHQVFDVPVTDMAADLGNSMARVDGDGRARTRRSRVWSRSTARSTACASRFRPIAGSTSRATSAPSGPGWDSTDKLAAPAWEVVPA